MKLGALKTDLAKVEQGMWIDDIPDMGNLRLKVRPIGNPDYRRLYGQLVEATPRDKKRGGMVTDYETKQQIAGRALADTVLLDWENLEGDDGAALAYDPAHAKKLLLDPEMVAFRDAVSFAATVAQEQSIGSAKDNAGN
jgi:hypothetical protein